MNGMDDFKVGDLVFHLITNTGWNYRHKNKSVRKTAHEGVVKLVREKTCLVEFSPGLKPKVCMKSSLKLRDKP